jgi:TnpA family transposase
MDWVEDQWDRMGHFYASLEYGHATASTAMKRLNGFSGKNQFYRPNRELGRIFKTEYILRYMSDKSLRQKVKKGLLKGEQIHSLARDLKYGKRGRICPNLPKCSIPRQKRILTIKPASAIRKVIVCVNGCFNMLC